MSERLVPVGRIVRAHGVRGEVRVVLFNEASTLLLRQTQVVLRQLGQPDCPVSLRGQRPTPRGLIVGLVGVDDRERAQALQGALILVPRSAFPPLAEGEFYAVDIEGARVVDPQGDVGYVVAMRSYPTCDALVVATPDGEIDVPLQDTFIASVDAAGGRVVLHDRNAVLPQ